MVLHRILIILIFFNIIVYAQNINWYSSYDKALNMAQKENKNLFLFITKSNSLKSKKVLATIFQEKKLIRILNKNFVSVLINVDYKTSYPIELFYTNTFPSIFFASYKNESFLRKPIYNINEEENIYETIKNLGN